jgi:hypothetical protein
MVMKEFEEIVGKKESDEDYAFMTMEYACSEAEHRQSRSYAG